MTTPSNINIIVKRLLETAAKKRASDLHLSVGTLPTLRIDEQLVEIKEEDILTPEFLKEFTNLVLNEQQRNELDANREISTVVTFADKFRFRLNVFYQKDNLAISLRLIPDKIINLADFGLPKSVFKWVEAKQGLIIIAGPYGSGRTAIASSFLEEINRNRKEKIITIEKPVEYLISSKKSLVEQREVGRDVKSFSDALRYCQQEDVNIIAVSETEEKEALFLILELATTGHLVFFIVNAMSAIQTLEKILAIFSPPEKKNVQTLLTEGLVGILILRLLPQVGGGQALALETLQTTDAVKSIIRDDKIFQLTSVIQTSKEEGMISLDQSLAQLVKSQRILFKDALAEAIDKENFSAMAR